MINQVFSKLQPYLLEKPYPLIGAETVQLIVMREVLDYTVLRTEETRELNTVHTPSSINNNETVRRVAFLATKQKAAESRELEQMLRTALRMADLKHVQHSKNHVLTDNTKKNDEEILCYLKDNLCMYCPRCALYGATRTEVGQQERANIKHRIEYSTAFSLLPYEEIGASVTFNAINDRTLSTGQALGQRHVVQPATLFPSIVTLKSVTKEELILAIKTLLSCKSYGAETRIGGDIRNSIWGIVFGWEEVITSLELTLELADNLEVLNQDTVNRIVEKKYKPMSGNPKKVEVLNLQEVEALIRFCAETNLDRAFLEKSYQDVFDYRASQLVR
ncbi:MAG: type I-D CRISPR-associated protein Cas7/Csc2 [Desulfitobacteriaceae bacterium]